MAISIVVLSHAGLGKFIPGKFGVTFFFFLSGFLITRLLLSEIKEQGNIHFTAFYLRRLFRLYPALLVMIICSVIAANLMQCSLSGKDIVAALFYYTNYYIGWFRSPVEDCSRLLDILWSLSVEEHFYLLFPLFIQIALSSNSNNLVKRFSKILLALCAISILIRVATYFYYQGNLDQISGVIYFSTHTRMDSIIWGCLAAVFLFGNNNTSYSTLIQNKWIIASAILALLLSVVVRNDFLDRLFCTAFKALDYLY